MGADSIGTLRTARLVLTPLTPSDAAEMVGVLGDPELYAFTGGEAPSLVRLQARYEAQAAGSPDPDERWHNWIVRLSGSRVAVGYVQATVTGREADIAWVIGVAWQRRGLAREAAGAMGAWLRRDAGVRRITAHIRPDHAASAAVAGAVGLRPTTEIDADGEQVWASRSDRWA